MSEEVKTPKKQETKVVKLIELVKKQKSQLKEVKTTLKTIEDQTKQLTQVVMQHDTNIKEIVNAFNNHIHIATPTVTIPKQLIQEEDEDLDLE